MRNPQPAASPRSAAHLQCRRWLDLRLLAKDVEVGVEGRHDVARVGLEAEAGQAGHGALQLRLGEEAEEANHGEAPVVDLGDQALGLLLRRLVLRDLERIVQVERHRVRQLVERREVARLAW